MQKRPQGTQSQHLLNEEPSDGEVITTSIFSNYSKKIIQLSNKIIPTKLFDTGLSLRENINNIQIISTSTKKIEN